MSRMIRHSDHLSRFVAKKPFYFIFNALQDFFLLFLRVKSVTAGDEHDEMLPQLRVKLPDHLTKYYVFLPHWRSMAKMQGLTSAARNFWYILFTSSDISSVISSLPALKTKNTALKPP